VYKRQGLGIPVPVKVVLGLREKGIDVELGAVRMIEVVERIKEVMGTVTDKDKF
jgi:hypothetical protein